MEAAAAVCGIQAQDVRAAGLALRSRVPGLTRADVDAADLVRTWTVRGTVHLIPSGDRAWLHALCAPRFGARFEGWLEKRGGLEIARAAVADSVDVLAQRPQTRAELLSELSTRGHRDLGPYAVNSFVPWLSQLGLVVGLADGRLRAAEPPEPVAEDEALATLGRRYLAGYGPATAQDLATWSGLPLGLARRALAAAGTLDRVEGLVALPGTFDGDPPPLPPPRLLAAFDTLLLGWRTRGLWIDADDDRHVLRGGGMIRATLLVGGRLAAVWTLAGGGRTRRLSLEPFGRLPPRPALASEVADVARFLGLDLELAL